MDFSPNFFKQNRKELLKRSKAKLLVIPAHMTMQRNLDNVYPFRQESNFWYLSGIQQPDCVLVVSSQDTFVIMPKRDWVEEVFDGAIQPDELTKISGISQILPEREGWQKLTTLLRKHKTVGVLPPAKQRHFTIAMNPARAQLISKLKRRVKNLEFEDVRLHLSRMRMIKQPQEIAVLQRAIDITSDTLQEVFAAGWEDNYKTEYELDADITAGFRRRGASGHGFTPIIANGAKTCTIHPIDNSDPLKAGELLLVDLGAEVSNYTADISRIIPIGGTMTARQREIFDAVKDVQKYAYSVLKPGQNYVEYEGMVETYMGKKLMELKVIENTKRELIRTYFPHATGHSLGLDPHDAADYHSEIQENMVLTVEPGIYIPEEGIGIRIEDVVLITKNGPKILSQKLPVRLW